MKWLFVVISLFLARLVYAQVDEVLVPASPPPIAEEIPDHYRMHQVDLGGCVLNKLCLLSAIYVGMSSGGYCALTTDGQCQQTAVTFDVANARNQLATVNTTDLTQDALDGFAFQRLEAEGKIVPGDLGQGLCSPGDSVGPVCTIWIPDSAPTPVEDSVSDYQIAKMSFRFAVPGLFSADELSLTLAARKSSGAVAKKRGDLGPEDYEIRQVHTDSTVSALRRNNGSVKSLRRATLEFARDKNGPPDDDIPDDSMIQGSPLQ